MNSDGTITMYRGFRTNQVMEKKKRYAYEGNYADSWTADPQIALSFANDKKSVILKCKVPIDRVLFSFFGDKGDHVNKLFNFSDEMEFIVNSKNIDNVEIFSNDEIYSDDENITMKKLYEKKHEVHIIKLDDENVDWLRKNVKKENEMKLMEALKDICEEILVAKRILY